MSTPIKSATKTPMKKTPKKTPLKMGDRFIPNRRDLDLDVAHFSLTKENSAPNALLTSPSKEAYKNSLSECLFERSIEGTTANGGAKILSFKNKPAPAAFSGSRNAVLYSQSKEQTFTKGKSNRFISQTPEKILDAPDLLDDYYLNLLSWSSQNVLAIALGQSVFLWNGSSGETRELFTFEEGNHPTSVNFVPDGNYLAVGTENSEVQLWDIERSKMLRNMRGHMSRVGSLAWNNHILSSGSRDSHIFNHDVRIAQHHIQTLSGHQQEVCGLQWSADGSQLASGGNDNLLHIWDEGQEKARFVLDGHQAAVKAVAFCPWQSNLLATGGGTADRCIKFWNTTTGACLNSIDTNSQVCAIQWSKHQRELVSSHGFSQNQLCVWKYPSMVKVSELTGHSSRVLHLATSPDGQTVVSAAADETLRFWKIFEEDKTQAASISLSKENKSSVRKISSNTRSIR